MTFDITKIARPNILTLEPYRCARDDFQEGILLDANENTHGPTLAEISKEEMSLDLNRYPDPHQLKLKQQVCDYRNSKSQLPEALIKPATGNEITPENLCFGVGSDESIDALIRCCVTPAKEKVVLCPPTYGMYGICSIVNDIGITEVPLDFSTFQIQPEKIINAIKDDPEIKLIYVTSPGNPTATQIHPALILQVIKAIEKMSWPGFLVVDEAYVDFAPQGSSMCVLVNEHPNLVVMQTFSKAFGLAGIRLGVTYSTPKLSILLNSMKYPYNINNITSDVALRATTKASLALKEITCKKIIAQRDVVVDKILKMKGVGENIGGMDANFLLIQLVNSKGEPDNKVAYAVYSELANKRKVVVRFRGNEPGCLGCLRITIGTAQENARLLKDFEEVLSEVLKEN